MIWIRKVVSIVLSRGHILLVAFQDSSLLCHDVIEGRIDALTLHHVVIAPIVHIRNVVAAIIVLLDLLEIDDGSHTCLLQQSIVVESAEVYPICDTMSQNR